MSPSTKTERLQIRLAAEDYEILAQLSESFGLDMSATVRFLVREKALERGLITITPPAKKKRARRA